MGTGAFQQCEGLSGYISNGSWSKIPRIGHVQWNPVEVWQVRHTEETDSTEVKYKIRQWSLPGATIVPVLNVSSRVFWLELDDKALLDSYSVLQEVFFCLMAAWLNEVVVRAVALLSALTKEFTMHIILQ